MSVTGIVTDDPTVAGRYLADQLTEAERLAFEERLLDDPQALRELEATARLKVGLHKLRRADRLETLARERHSRTPWLFGIAAVVCTLVIGIGLFRTANEATPTLAAQLAVLVDDNGHPLGLGPRYAVFHKRGGAHDAVVRLPTSRRAIELRVLPDLARQAGPYRAVLHRAANADRTAFSASIAGLEPAGDGGITLFVDSGRMTPGNYELGIYDAGGDTVDTFALGVIPAQ